MNVDMSSSMQMLATFIAPFSGPSTLRIKIKYCVLCESVCSRTDTLTIWKDNPARYIILDILLQWMSQRVRFLFLPSRSRLTCYRYQRRPRMFSLTISIWHVFERSSNCWIVCSYVHSILPIPEMMPYIMFHDFSINIRQRCLWGLKPVSLKWSVPSSYYEWFQHITLSLGPGKWLRNWFYLPCMMFLRYTIITPNPRSPCRNSVSRRRNQNFVNLSLLAWHI
jgi:hypothetical protein